MRQQSNIAVLILSAMLFNPASAATVALSSTPLVGVTSGQALPNIMFVMDNSTGMGLNYMPEIAGNYQFDTTLFDNPAFNGVMYDVNVRYAPPAYFNADGSSNATSYPSQDGTAETALISGKGTGTGADSSGKPNWKRVRYDYYGIELFATNANSNPCDATGETCNLQGTAASGKIFGFVSGEICTSTDLTKCEAGAAPTADYPVQATLRWCKTSADATAALSESPDCRASYIKATSIQDAGYAYARYPSVLTVAYTPSTAAVSHIKVDGNEILSAPTAAASTTAEQAMNVANAINACNGINVGNCAVAGFGATVSGSTVTIYANASAAKTALITVGSSDVALSFVRKKNATTNTANNNVPGYNLLRVIPVVGTSPIYPAMGGTTKASARTDCVGTSCTANEELTNYANWYTYYHTRLQTAKSGIANAFKSVSNNYRVGFNVTGNTSDNFTFFANYLSVGKFETGFKQSWYNNLFTVNTVTVASPMRQAVVVTGQYFANKWSRQDTDPMQYSCQQNFGILAGDGYWADLDSTVVDLKGNKIGDLDTDPNTSPIYEGTTKTYTTMADAAKYYYDTDIRNSAYGNCTGDGGNDVCTDNVPTNSADSNNKQHLTLYTIGLGVDGRVNYQSDYLTATSGDFYKIKMDTLDWPVPVTNTETTIDDMWHAAVNGHGEYFNAKNPTQLGDSLSSILTDIAGRLGAGGAAATSTLNPVAGDNDAYIGSYTTAKWYGNLEARSIDTTTGQVSETAKWCAEDVAADTCATPGVVIESGNSTQTYCVSSNVTTASACPAPGVYDSTLSTCSVPMAVACTGTLPALVKETTDTRAIYVASAGALIDFSTSSVGAYMDPTKLSQYANLTADQRANATTATLVGYLRGQYGYEASSATVANQVYRTRVAVMGDVIESAPAYIKQPIYSYSDPGYSTFAATARSGAVYVGANDGMLHAFDATTGKENWAFVPTPVLPNMYKLADKLYGGSDLPHVNYVNGDISIGDICVSSCSNAADAVWKTILVGGLHAGGRGYYALDITNPTSPKLLWEYTSTSNAAVGYSYGKPLITKLNSGQWVVVLTSGYNNGTNGHVFVLDANTGALAKTAADTALDISVGATTDSGLAQINAYVADLNKNNTAGYVYGGDLNGDLWRVDINAGTVMKFAALTTDGTTGQPITVRPELSTVNGVRMVYVGTGKYLEQSDLTNKQVQTVYGISDPEATSTLTDKTGLTKQTLSAVAGTAYRTVTSNAAGARGWYINLPDSASGSERQNVPSLLVSGTLIIPTNVPKSSVCTPGGYGWLNYVDYRTGGAVNVDNPNAYGSEQTTAMIAGLNVLYLGTALTPVIEVVGADNPTPKIMHVPIATSPAFQGQRIYWREVTN
jgi:type IV pilus assembly protein PilY1